MHKNRVFFVLSCLILAGICAHAHAQIKEPNVSGMFYPSNKEALSVKIDEFFKSAQVQPLKEDIFVLVSPHAGYIYSGPVAAYGYKLIQSRNYNTVIILAPSHYAGFRGISVWKEGAFRTPLADALVDSEFADRLISESDKASFIPEVFDREHSLEVQIPFLQKALNYDFKIVPVIVGLLGFEDSKKLALVLKNIIAERKDALIVASSDFSHYKQYKEAVAADKNTLSYLLNFNVKGLNEKNLPSDIEPCGIRPITIAFLTAKELGLDKVKLLKYANSGDATGDKTRGVVGYASLVVYRESNKQESEKAMFNKEQREKLLSIARGSLESYVINKRRMDVDVSDPQLKKVQGAFVTLNKEGRLRGCIGRIIADKPLVEVVRDMAIEAATGDPRFNPVTKDEIPDIEIEVSVLSPIEKITDVNKIKVGTHGIILKRGFHQGLLLPQVATDYGWDRDTFLENTCFKAGLPADAWKDKQTEIYIFSAEVFGEQSH